MIIDVVIHGIFIRPDFVAEDEEWMPELLSGVRNKDPDALTDLIVNRPELASLMTNEFEIIEVDEKTDRVVCRIK